ncbi:MAG: hypothetical protein ACPHCI_10395 [Solirubrobacterales bacterium]
MDVKELRPKVDPETCSICGRRLLQGESVNWYVTPDSTRRAVCELCIPRAERVRWAREREGEEIVQLRPVRGERAGLFRRVSNFFGGVEADESEEFAVGSDRPGHRRERPARRRDREAEEMPPPPTRDVRAEPTEPEARLDQGIELFNLSQFPRTIAGLTRSLGDPQVAALNNSDGTVEVIVGWDIAWYSYRVTLGDATEPVEQSGRGNDVAELVGRITDWNAAADGFGRLFLIDAEPAEAPNQSPKKSSDLSVGDDQPL